jgi:hypothetical protein
MKDDVRPVFRAAGAAIITNKNKKLMTQDRRNDYDVTNTVQVSNPVAVRDAVYVLFSETFPGASFDKLWLAFYDCARLFTGQYPGYNGCDTTYHDMQHTLDMTLALARLVVGYERSVDPAERLGASRAQMVISPHFFMIPVTSGTRNAIAISKTARNSRFIMYQEVRISCDATCPSLA